MAKGLPHALPPDAETRKNYFYHDKSIFSTNEGQTWMWTAEDAPIILPKAALWSVILLTHTLAFCNLLTQNMPSLARATDTEFPNTARVLLEYGMDKEGYWTSEKL